MRRLLCRVLADARRWTERWSGLAVDRPRTAGHAERRARVVDEDAASDGVIEIEQRPRWCDRAHGDAQQRRALDDLGSGVLRRPCVNDLVPLVEATHARSEA